MQTRDDDDKTLHPHADVDEERDDEKRERIAPDARRPERLRNEHVAQHQHPENPAIGTERAIHHHVFFEDVAAVPRHEGLDEVAVGTIRPVANMMFAMLLR